MVNASVEGEETQDPESHLDFLDYWGMEGGLPFFEEG
tara:strand:+ start:229 stop:339 length:111 start_codon:yes stop_codon:yes gene_type:complete